MGISFLPCGDTAFTVEFGDRVDRALSRRVLALHAALRGQPLPGIVETVPTFRSLLVHYDPLETTQRTLRELILPIASTEMESELRGKNLTIPVCYDEEVAPDLESVASITGMPPEQVVRIHCETVHYVYMVGFAPGHPYLGDLPEALTLPRRKDPRPKVSAGTIATAVGLTVIYPFDNPCGWHVIGQTPLRLFDPRRSPPNLVGPGDTIKFRPVSIEEFRRLDISNAESCNDRAAS
jgi:KipI family sensor histidine kinase inhibitor